MGAVERDRQEALRDSPLDGMAREPLVVAYGDPPQRNRFERRMGKAREVRRPRQLRAFGAHAVRELGAARLPLCWAGAPWHALGAGKYVALADRRK